MKLAMKSQTWDGLTATCNHCGVAKTFTREQIRRDDACLDQVPCQGSDDCDQWLCPSCRQECPGCGLATCREHLEPVDPSEPRHLLCAICRAAYYEAQACGINTQPDAKLAVLAAQDGMALAEAGVSVQEAEAIAAYGRWVN